MAIVPGRASERVRDYLAEHPSVRRALALAVVNDAALARRIRAETGERLSVEAIAVALRRAERVARSERAWGPALPQLVGGGTLELLPDYAVLRLRDEPVVWARLEELRHALARTRRPPTVLFQVEEGAPRISLLCPAALVPRVRRTVPPRSVESVRRGVSLVVLEADQAADNTPGVIAVLAELLSDQGLLPGPLIAAGRRVSFAAPTPLARHAFELLHEVRRVGSAPEESSRPAAPPRPGGSTVLPPEESRSGAEVARAYVAGHPSIADCLAYGIVNFTALARRITDETGSRNPDAVEAALRRWRNPRAGPESVEHRLVEVVRASRIEIRTRVALVNAPHSWTAIARVLESDAARAADQRQMFQILQGPTSVTLLCDEELLDPVLRSLGPREAIRTTTDLSAVVVRSPAAIVETPGVLAYLSQALARAGLNCVELMSVQLESTFIVRQSDALETFRVLSALIHPAEPGEERPARAPSEPRTAPAAASGGT